MPTSPGRRRATITEVARHLGVSKSTVSRAFNRPQLLLPETVADVKAASIALGYRPSRSARALSTGLSSAIALVVPDIANPFFPNLIRAAQAAAEERGMVCLLGDTDERADREWQLVTGFAPDVDGVVLMSPRLPTEKVRDLAAHTNLVLVNRDIDGLRRVMLDTAGGFDDALHHLYGLGHRAFAYIAGPDRSWSNAERRRIIEAFAATHDIRLTVQRAHPATYAGGTAAGAAVLAEAPTAILCFDDVVAQGVAAAAGHAGLQIPRDLSIVGCDDTIASAIHPQAATIALDYRTAGISAVEMLLDDISTRTDIEDGRLRVPGRFVTGASLGPPGQHHERSTRTGDTPEIRADATTGARPPADVTPQQVRSAGSGGR